ncbi:MAG: septum formation inhibitor Maf [Dactylosporangium sp.]|nr:septum formation inhibitor Maf [Dactylosporangium sp.]NNJ63416.1 septum formation inhibitor Maf [Dactylosporangium sp.]
MADKGHVKGQTGIDITESRTGGTNTSRGRRLPLRTVATVTHSLRLILASASPARLKTLRAAGLDAEVIVSGIDESTITDRDPELLSGTLARLKAEAVASTLADGRSDALVLGCDSVLAFNGGALGKPADAAEAVERWRALRGASGVLYTGHCLISMATGQRTTKVAATTVHFADVTDREITAYVATGEPLGVAGAFTIDGLGGPFVERIDGDPGTVIGLSLPLLRRLMRSHGVQLTDLWAPGAERSRGLDGPPATGQGHDGRG